mgnify:CR=1 FL=1
MKDFIIITDSCSDLDTDYISQKEIPFVSLTCRIEDLEYKDDFGQSLSYKSFYDYMRHGKVPKTSQPSVHDFHKVFEEYVSKGLDILYICVSSGLSGTYNCAYIAKKMIQDDYPDNEIYIFDALTASVGQGLMVIKAVEMKENGYSMESIVDYLEMNVQRLNTFIIVNDLSHLRRGGRISASAAVIGRVLNINPVLTLNHQGKVINIMKIRGRKKAVAQLADFIAERIEAPEEQTIAINHGDCMEEALELKRIIQEKVPVRDVYINFIGPVVGTYGGPGAMAVFFLGKERQQHIYES